MVELGCGNGRFLHELWALGFDVSGVENSPQLASEARQRLGQSVPVEIAAADHSPFEEQAFDYVVLANVLHGHADLIPLLDEAARLASRGIMVIFPGKWSLFRLFAFFGKNRMSAGTPKEDTGEDPKNNVKDEPKGIIHMLSALRSACPDGYASLRSAGIVPESAGSFVTRLNRIVMPLPVGKYIAIRFDFDPQPPVTGLPLIVNASRLNSVPGTAPLASREQVSQAMCPRKGFIKESRIP